MRASVYPLDRHRCFATGFEQGRRQLSLCTPIDQGAFDAPLEPIDQPCAVWTRGRGFAPCTGDQGTSLEAVCYLRTEGVLY